MNLCGRKQWLFFPPGSEPYEATGELVEDFRYILKLHQEQLSFEDHMRGKDSVAIGGRANDEKKDSHCVEGVEGRCGMDDIGGDKREEGHQTSNHKSSTQQQQLLQQHSKSLSDVIVIDQLPGQAMFVPSGWHHQVSFMPLSLHMYRYFLTYSISLSMTSPLPQSLCLAEVYFKYIHL